MEGFLTLLLLCAAMGVTTFGVGMVPLHLALSKTNMRRLSTFSMGILVGTALIIVIPEGVDVLYKWESSQDGDGHHHRMRIVRDNKQHLSAHFGNRSHKDAHSHESAPAHRHIGLALAVGFILMHLIDQIPKLRLRSGMPSYSAVPLRSMVLTSEQLEEDDTLPPLQAPASTERSPLSIGLIIHAAADGVALGAASSSNNVPLKLVVFVSLALHKVPVAVGFAALIKNNQTRNQARRNLFAFALASPLAAIVTYGLVYMIGHSGPINESAMMWWTGYFLLISGGTFLYVAIHSMQGHDSHVGHGNSEVKTDHTVKTTTLSDILLFVGGAIVPSIIEMGGGHHH